MPNDVNHSPTGPGRGRHLRLSLVLGAASAFAPFATDMYLPSFPLIERYFHTDPGMLQLTLSVFFLGLGVGQLIYGPLIDRFGRRSLLLAGIAVFTAAALLSVIAPDIHTLIGLRLLQALGGCSGMVIGRTMVQDLFDERESAQVLSSIMVVQSLGPIIAPLLGGYLVAFSSWKIVFVFLGLFGAVCLAAALTLPETLAPQLRRSPDLAQIVRTYAALLVQRSFVVPTLAGSLVMSGLFVFIGGSPFVIMQLHGVSVQHYSWLFGLNTGGMLLASTLNRRLLRHTSAGTLFTAALLVNLLASGLLVASAGSHSLTVLMVPLWFAIATIPVIAANSTAVAMAVSGAAAGSASALIGVLQFALATVAVSAISLFQNGTAYPMAIIMAAGSLAGGLVHYFGHLAGGTRAG